LKPAVGVHVLAGVEHAVRCTGGRVARVDDILEAVFTGFRVVDTRGVIDLAVVTPVGEIDREAGRAGVAHARGAGARGAAVVGRRVREPLREVLDVEGNEIHHAAERDVGAGRHDLALNPFAGVEQRVGPIVGGVGAAGIVAAAAAGASIVPQPL